MGVKLFGQDIAAIVKRAMSSGLPRATLRRPTASPIDPANPTANPTVSYRSFPCRGFEDSSAETRRMATAVQQTGRLVLLLGDTLPASVFPAPGDLIVILGEELEIIGEGVSSDPARATYLCACRG